MTDWVPWLRGLAAKGRKGVVHHIDARCLGRLADEIERLRDENAKRENALTQAVTITKEMIAAGSEAIDDYYNGTKDAPFKGSVEACYRAMRALEPSRATQAGGERDCCGFCGKFKHEVARLIDGPITSICNECIVLLRDMLEPTPADAPKGGRSYMSTYGLPDPDAPKGDTPQSEENGCKCQGCSAYYRVDFLVPDDVWGRISPKNVDGFKGGGLLCGRCIVERIEGFGDFGAFHVSPADNLTPDQIAYLHELADDRRKRWQDHKSTADAPKGDVLSKRPVAFRVKNGEGWSLYHSEELAYAVAEENGAVMQGLYVRDGTPNIFSDAPKGDVRKALSDTLRTNLNNLTLGPTLPGDPDQQAELFTYLDSLPKEERAAYGFNPPDEAAWAEMVEYIQQRAKPTPSQDEGELRQALEERNYWNNDACRLSAGLLAIRGAAETVPASVLRGIAYDVALNCMDAETAKFQIERRAREVLSRSPEPVSATDLVRQFNEWTPKPMSDLEAAGLALRDHLFGKSVYGHGFVGVGVSEIIVYLHASKKRWQGQAPTEWNGFPVRYRFDVGRAIAGTYPGDPEALQDAIELEQKGRSE